MTLNATGSLTREIGAADLVSGAGTDLNSTYESSTSVVTLDLSNTLGSSWKVQVMYSETTWDPALSVSVRRTTDGTGSGTITGGDSYQAITGTYTDLFTGSDDRTGIQLQVKLSGMSVSLGVETFVSDISFKIVPDSKLCFNTEREIAEPELIDFEKVKSFAKPQKMKIKK